MEQFIIKINPMKKGITEALILFVILSVFSACILVSCNNSAQEGRRKVFQEQLGTYVLDIHKTELGKYSKDSNLYKNLSIIFKPDSTFYMNIKVPFIYDSTGTWQAGNLNEWNYLFYKSNPNINTQFTRPETADSTFLLNSTTPQAGADFIQEIYFRKISP